MKALVFRLSPARWALTKALSFLHPSAASGPLSPLQLEDRPMPEPTDSGWVRLRTILGGVCGTDLALIALRNHPATILQRFSEFPAVLGHENVAVIDALGPATGDWKVGDRVCAGPAISCVARGAATPCRWCAAGLFSLCEHPGDGRLPPRPMLGYNRLTGGTWAPYFLAHVSQLHRVPESVSDDAAVLTDPLASSVHAVLRRRPQPDDRILVSGSGIIALGVIAGLRALGHANPVTAVVRHDHQADLARRLGATDALVQPRRLSHGHRYDQIAKLVRGVRMPARFGNQALIGGFDLTYECTGASAGLTDAMKWTRSRGTVILAGTTGIGVFDTTPIWFDELEVLGANGRQIESLDGRSVHTYDMVLEWLATRRIDASAIPVTRSPLTDYRRALRAVLSRGRGRIVKLAFDPNGM